MSQRFVPALFAAAIFLGFFNTGTHTVPLATGFSLTPSSVFATGGVVLPPPPVLPPPVVRTCEVSADFEVVEFGASVTISWQTQGFSVVTLNGQTVASPNGSYVFTNIQANTTYTLVAKTADGKTECVTSVTVVCIPVPPIPTPTCTLTPAALTINAGQSATLTWTTTNAASATLTTFGSVPLSGSRNTGPLMSSTNYTLQVLGENGETINCYSHITVTTPPPIPVPTCTLTPAAVTINAGEAVTLTWTTTNAASATLTTFGSVPLSGSRNTGPLATSTNYTLRVVGENGTTINCHSYITVTLPPPPIPAPTCVLTPAAITINAGESVTLTWSTTNATSATLTTFGSVPLSGTRTTPALTNSTTYTLTVIGKNGSTISCPAVITVRETPPPTPVPVCESFSASPSTIIKGASSTLTWSTRNATRVVINNGIGEVAATGTQSVSPLATIEYTLTVFGVNDQSVSCKTTVTVDEPPVIPAPSCEAFSATPSTLPASGGSVVLAWTTKNATGVSISPTVGAVALNGTTSVAVSSTTTYVLTVTGTNNQSDNCAVTVTVQPPVVPPTPITCENNVTFTANPRSITRGDDSTLTWTTTGIDSLSFNQGITATGLSGTVSVSPNDTTTYTLTATTGTTTIACPVTVTVSSGGGGGGSSTPTCELSISKNRISRGEEVVLRWDSARAGDLEIVDSFDKVLVTTKGKLSKDKEEYFDGSLRLSPTRDTTYTLTVERGSRDRVCRVSVDVTDSVSVTQTREQLPLIAGISLSEVPYTGFEAGPFLTISFYALLMAWSLYVAYLIAIRKDIIGGYRLASEKIIAPLPSPEDIRPDLFVASVRVTDIPPSVQMTPVNLPVGNPVVGYASAPGVATLSAPSTTQSLDEIVTTLENHAHAKKALLSSDAIRHFIGSTSNQAERITALNDVIMLAKEKYPAEDGWVVINEKRMQDLCVVCQAKPLPSSAAPYVPTVIPEGSGSLAEAIVTGNVIAAYEMIGHRPMFALADAASDLDSIYRSRRGAEVIVSDLLLQATQNLTDEQIMQMIQALTGALDGVYTDEASAVKMAIMKAVKVAS